MSHSIKEVMQDKKGIADALGIMMLAMMMLAGVGVMVVTYAIHTKQVGQIQSISQEISNRAEVYAATLNKDLVNPEIASMGRQCSSLPAMCSNIVSDTPDPLDPGKRVLRIQGDAISGVGQSMTKDVTLVSKEVTHVTGIDKNGENIWALSNEGLRYRIWGLAAGEPLVVTDDDIVAPVTGNQWVTLDDRAGIDSTGALWVWGANNVGQAGVGSISATPVAPRKIAGTAKFRSVTTTNDRGYAIDSRGDVWVWGKNTVGQLGLGHANPVLVPTKIANSRTMSVAAGKDNTFFVGMDGSLSVVGANQAGFPANTGYTAQVLNPGTKYKSVSASPSGALAMVDSYGTLTMMGAGYPFSPNLSENFADVSLGATSGYAITTSGFLYSWGTGTDGQLGLGGATSVNTPTRVSAGTRFVEVSAGVSSVFAIDTAGQLYYFGKSPAGFVGSDLTVVNSPTKLLPESRFRGVGANSGDTAVALLDTAGNAYGLGTVGPGLWPMTYMGSNNQPIRMPALEGFAPG